MFEIQLFKHFYSVCWVIAWNQIKAADNEQRSKKNGHLATLATDLQAKRVQSSPGKKKLSLEKLPNLLILRFSTGSNSIVQKTLTFN